MTFLYLELYCEKLPTWELHWYWARLPAPGGPGPGRGLFGDNVTSSKLASAAERA